MRSSLLLALSALGLFACASAPAEDTASSEGAATASAPTSPSAGTYHATCVTRYSSIELTVTIANGRVTSLRGDIDGRDGKLMVQHVTTSWTGQLDGQVSKVSPLPAASSASLTLDGHITPLDVSKLTMESESSEEPTTVSTCGTSARLTGLDLRARMTPDGYSRGITLFGVAPEKDCFAEATPLDEEHAWDFDCDEDDVHSSSEGLVELVEALNKL